MGFLMNKIIAISGSTRKNSYNGLLLELISTLLPDNFVMEVCPIINIPLYNYDEEQKNGLPHAVADLKEKIIHSDALLISTPEYNHGIPGVLKNAIDWLTRPPEDVKRVFHDRKVGLIGASPSRLGTAFAQTAWLPILGYLNTHTYFGEQLFLSSVHTLFGDDGRVTDEQAKKLIQSYVTGFCNFIES